MARNPGLNTAYTEGMQRELNAIGRTHGKVFYVNSEADNASDNNAGSSWNKQMATLDAAVGLCTDNEGDFIYLAQGHAEDIIIAAGTDIDVAGVTIIGLGRGASRPTFTFTTAVDASFDLAAADVSVSNIYFVAGVDSMTGNINVTAANCALIDCEFEDGTTATIDTIDVVILSAGADDCLIDGFRMVHTGDQQQSAIQVPTGADGVEIRNCFIIVDTAVGCIECAQATNLFIHHNTIENLNASDICITLGSTSTGIISHNNLKIATDTQTTWITAVNDCGLFENYGVNADAETGGVIGTVST